MKSFLVLNTAELIERGNVKLQPTASSDHPPNFHERKRVINLKFDLVEAKELFSFWGKLLLQSKTKFVSTKALFESRSKSFPWLPILVS